MRKPTSVLADPPADGKPHPGRKLTEAEFDAWIDENTQAEWVDGEVIMKDEATPQHERISIFLLALLTILNQTYGYGEVLGTQVAVRLAPQRRRRVPDITFVAKERRHIITEQRIEGAPDLIMEIVSPDSGQRDLVEKRAEYQRAGVREYWAISPRDRQVLALRLTSAGTYEPIALIDGAYHSGVIPGLWLNPDWLWQVPLPNVLDTLRDLGAL